MQAASPDVSFSFLVLRIITHSRGLQGCSRARGALLQELRSPGYLWGIALRLVLATMGMGDPRPLDFEADVSELTQGDPAEALLPLLRQLSGWEEVTGAPGLARRRRPRWTRRSGQPVTCRAPAQVDADAVSTVQIAGAMTNVIFRVQNLCTSEVSKRRARHAHAAACTARAHGARGRQFVLVRVFGEADALFSRSDEQCIFAAVARAGLGPRLLARARAALRPPAAHGAAAALTRGARGRRASATGAWRSFCSTRA